MSPRRRETHTPSRSVRVTDELWEAARTKAAAEGKTLSAVVVAALERYVRSKR